MGGLFRLFFWDANGCIAQSISRYQCWEPTLTYFVLALMNDAIGGPMQMGGIERRRAVVIDAGCFNGYYTQLALRSGLTVMAVDFNKPSIGLLEQGLKANQVDNGGQCFVLNCALGDQEQAGTDCGLEGGAISGERYDGGGANLRQILGRPAASKVAASSEPKVGLGADGGFTCLTIDNLISDSPPRDGYVRLVKVDVEGLEPNVVQGMLPLLRRLRVDYILCEFTPAFNTIASLEAAFESLQRGGYSVSVFTLQESGPLPESLGSRQYSPNVYHLPTYCARHPRQFNIAAHRSPAYGKSGLIIVGNDHLNAYRPISAPDGVPLFCRVDCIEIGKGDAVGDEGQLAELVRCVQEQQGSGVCEAIHLVLLGDDVPKTALHTWLARLAAVKRAPTDRSGRKTPVLRIIICLQDMARLDALPAEHDSALDFIIVREVPGKHYHGQLPLVYLPPFLDLARTAAAGTEAGRKVRLVPVDCHHTTQPLQSAMSVLEAGDVPALLKSGYSSHPDLVQASREIFGPRVPWVNNPVELDAKYTCLAQEQLMEVRSSLFSHSSRYMSARLHMAPAFARAVCNGPLMGTRRPPPASDLLKSLRQKT